MSACACWSQTPEVHFTIWPWCGVQHRSSSCQPWCCALLLQGAWGVCMVRDQQQRWRQLLFSCLIRRASGTLAVRALSVGGSGGASLSSAGPPRPRAAREHKEPGPELGTSSPLLLTWGYAVVNPGQSYWWRESNAVYELYSFINN